MTCLACKRSPRRLPRNSLEQLLINFANERLQAHFNEYLLMASDGV